MCDRYLGSIATAIYRIELKFPNVQPVLSAKYHTGLKAWESKKAKIDRMWRWEIIEPTQTEWVSTGFFIPKRHGTLFFCVDYQNLNFVTVEESYPLPRMDSFIDSLKDAQGFWTLDADSGYLQIKVDEEAREKTAITSRHSSYQLMRMPFGLKSLQATFQHVTDVIVSKVK